MYFVLGFRVQLVNGVTICLSLLYKLLIKLPVA